MTRRVGAPGALAEQRGQRSRRAAFPAPPRTTRPAIGSTSRGSFNGRTPRLTPRKSRSEPEAPNQRISGPTLLEQRRSALQPRDWTRSHDRLPQYTDSGPVPQRDGLARHEHPSPGREKVSDGAGLAIAALRRAARLGISMPARTRAKGKCGLRAGSRAPVGPRSLHVLRRLDASITLIAALSTPPMTIVPSWQNAGSRDRWGGAGILTITPRPRAS